MAAILPVPNTRDCFWRREHKSVMKFHKEEFAYRKERDATGDVMEVEDLQEIEATIYGTDNPQTQDHSV